MIEQSDNGRENIEKEKKVRRRLELAHELSESGEAFSFPGLHPDAYIQLKVADGFTDANYVTPIDALLVLFREQGMRVERGPQIIDTEKKTSVITVRPSATQAGFYGENLLHIKNLSITEGMDSRLAELIALATD